MAAELMALAHERGYGGPHPDRKADLFEYRVARSRTRGGESLCIDVSGLSRDQATKLEAHFLKWLVAGWPNRADEA